MPMLLGATLAQAADPLRSAERPRVKIVVGSKAFPESQLLGSMLAQLIEAQSDFEVQHRAGLGGTMICQAALLAGEIDLYPEYSGTAWTTVLKRSERVTDALQTFLDVQAAYLDQFDAIWLQPFGFNNTYVLAMPRARALELGIECLSDLASKGGELRAGFSIEFMNRPDGLPGLSEFYGIDLSRARGVEHTLAYQALESGELELLDAYSTDAELASLDLLRLRDDHSFFPPYHAAPVLRNATLSAHPELRAIIERLAFRLSDARMAELNLRVRESALGFDGVAREFLREAGLLGREAPAQVPSDQRLSNWAYTKQRAPIILDLTLTHLKLSALAVGLAILIGLPLCLWLVARPRATRSVLALASVIQTVPGLALLALLIALPYFGLSQRSAVLALFLYSLLPILRGAQVGLAGMPPGLLESARAIGLRPREILLRVRLPLAIPSILGGIRTATVICIGLGTLAAFIGAGGLGEPILTGLYLNDKRLILSGALGAACLALLSDALLGLLQRRLTPRGLRL